MNRAAALAIRDLDAELARSGELIKIGRLHDAPGGDHVTHFAELVPAKVTLASPQDIDVTSSTNSSVIISPSQLTARQWPAPPRRDDRIWIGEQVGVVESVRELRINGQVVRYEMECRS